MDNNLVLELKQKSSSNVLNNGDYSVSLSKSIVINENDEVSISKVFIDNVSTTDNKTIIEKDITVSMDVILYQNNCNNTQKTYADIDISEDGNDYIWCDAVKDTDPRGEGLEVVTEFLVKIAPGSPENSLWGKDRTHFPIKWQGYDNQTYYGYCLIHQQETNYFYPSRSFLHIRDVSILCKVETITSDDRTHVWRDNLCVFGSVTQTSPATNNVLFPIINTFTLDLDAGQYLPDDLCEVFNNSMGKNDNVDQLLTSTTLSASKFLDCTGNAIAICKTNVQTPANPITKFSLNLLSVSGTINDGNFISFHYSTDPNDPYGNSLGFMAGQTAKITFSGQSTEVINALKLGLGTSFTEAHFHNQTITLELSPTGTFTYLQSLLCQNDFNVNFPTNDNAGGTGAKAYMTIENFILTNKSFFTESNAKTYYRPSGLNNTDVPTETTSNTWIGSSQIEMKYNQDSNHYFWNFMHMPFYNNENISTGVGTVSAGINQGKFYRKDKLGGFAFHNVTAYTRGGDPEIDYYDFWEAKLGFIPHNFCVDFGHTENGTGVGLQLLPDFSKGEGAIWKDGISVTSARPDLDSMINKAGSSAEVIPAPTTIISTSTLNVEVISDQSKLAPILLNYGYYKIELTAGFFNEIIGENHMTKNINGIINRYYSLGTYTSAEGSSMVYIHKGASKILSDIGVRILDSNGILADGIGDDNTVFISILRNQQPSQQLLEQQKVLQEDEKQIIELSKK